MRSLATVCPILSDTVGIPSFLTPPDFFGISTQADNMLSETPAPPLLHPARSKFFGVAFSTLFERHTLFSLYLFYLL